MTWDWVNLVNPNEVTIRFKEATKCQRDTVAVEGDSKQLQEDLHKICEWTHKWQMKINVEKCAALRCIIYYLFIVNQQDPPGV